MKVSDSIKFNKYFVSDNLEVGGRSPLFEALLVCAAALKGRGMYTASILRSGARVAQSS